MLQPTAEKQEHLSHRIWLEGWRCAQQHIRKPGASTASAPIKKLLELLGVLMKKISVPVILVIFCGHEALLIADLWTSAKQSTPFTWSLYVFAALLGLLLPISAVGYNCEREPIIGFIWVVIHVIATLASAIGHYVSSVIVSDIFPSINLGTALALVIPMPAKDLSIIGTAAILLLVSIFLPFTNK